jgi:hypothetical protein
VAWFFPPFLVVRTEVSILAGGEHYWRRAATP